MRVGIYQDLRDPKQWERGWGANAALALERAEEAERLGLDSVWCTEHHFFEDGYLSQPLTWCAAVAARTKRIDIGTAIVIAPLHHPLEIAEQAAVVDQISGGRLHLGLGAGYVAREFDAFGADRTKRFSILDSYTAEVKRLLEEGVVTPGPYQDQIPIWIGGFGPRGARMAGRHGAGLLWLDEGLLEPYKEGLVEGGRSADDAVMNGLAAMIVSNDPERAWATMEPHLRYQWQSYEAAAMADSPDAGMMMLDENAKVERSDGPVMLPPGYDAVTPDEAVSRIETWLSGLPVSEVFFFDSLAGMPNELVDEHMTLLATEVKPRLADLGVRHTAVPAAES